VESVAENAAVKPVRAEAVSNSETVPVYKAEETLTMSPETHSSQSTSAAILTADGHRSSVGAILKLVIVIGLGLAAVFLLVEATKEGSVVGGVMMGIVLTAVGASLPFLVSDLRLSKER
jgi:hypothetical protein